MANTYTLIASSTVGSGGAADITFSAIPSTYTDLIVACSLRSARPGGNFADIRINFNGSTSNLTGKRLYGGGSYYGSSSTLTGVGNGAGNTANTFSNSYYYIPNYAGSNYKSWSSDTVVEDNATDAFMQLQAGLWSDTSAITSIKLFDDTGYNLLQYSTAYLYGISNS